MSSGSGLDVSENFELRFTGVNSVTILMTAGIKTLFKANKVFSSIIFDDTVAK